MGGRLAFALGGLVLVSAVRATTLDEVREGLRGAKRRALATAFQATESFESAVSIPWGRGEPSVYAQGVVKRDLAALAKDAGKWQPVPVDPPCRWASNGERFGIWQGMVTVVSDGPHQWRRHLAPSDPGEPIWLAEELRRGEADSGRWTADPISVGYRYPVLGFRDPEAPSSPWLTDKLDSALRATVKDLPNGRVALTWVDKDPEWEIDLIKPGRIGTGQMYWMGGSQTTAVLDPGRGYLAESISVRQVGEDLRPIDAQVTLVQDAERMGEAWVPTRYILSGGQVSVSGANAVFRATLSDLQPNPSAALFKPPFKEGDLRGQDISSPDAKPERLGGDGTWEVQPSKHEREEMRTTLEYGMYVGGFVSLIAVGYSIPQLIRRRKKAG